MTSWDHLPNAAESRPPAQSFQAGPNPLLEYTGLIRRGYDRDAASLATEEASRAAFANKRQIAQTRLDQLYSDKRYSVLEAHRAEHILSTLDEYGDLLTRPGEAGETLGRARDFRPEVAAMCLAAASIHHAEPISLNPIMRWLGIGSSRINTKVELATKFLTDNRMLIVAPDGARGLSDSDLKEFGLSGDELDKVGLGYTGIDEPPAALLVLAADIIHSSRSTLLPLQGRRVSQRKLEDAQDIVGRVKRLAAYSNTEVHRLNLRPDEAKALDEAGALISRAQQRSATEQQRADIRNSVHLAGMRGFNFGEADLALLDTMAELLVAKAHIALHETNPLPDSVLTAVAVRLANACRKNGVTSVTQLPGGTTGLAGHIYTLCADYLRERNAARATQSDPGGSRGRLFERIILGDINPR